MNASEDDSPTSSSPITPEALADTQFDAREASPPTSGSFHLPSLKATAVFGASLSPGTVVLRGGPAAPRDAAIPRAMPARTVQLSVDDHLELMRRSAPPDVIAPEEPRATVPLEQAPRTTLRRGRIAATIAVAVVALLVVGYLVARVVAANNRRWLAPVVLSSSDPRVLQVAATLQQETAHKNDLLLQQKELESRLRQAKRCAELEEGFQTSFKATMRSDLATRKAEMHRLQAALAQRDPASDDVKANDQYAALETRLAAARQRVRLLDEALREGKTTSSYEALALRRDYDQSLAAADAARDLVKALEKANGDVVRAIRAKDALLASLDESPYKLAIGRDVALGFLPYENLPAVKAGDDVFGCKTSLVFCAKVGTVGQILPGEVRGLHPTSGEERRGRLVTLNLDDASDGQRAVIYAQHGPLF